LFVCENNLYAMGTALTRSEAQTDLRAKAEGYRMRALSVDGMDVCAVETAAREAVAWIRAERRPLLFEARTYRLRAHSMYDPQLYRSRDEVLEWEQRGPLITLTQRLKAAGLMDEADFQRLQQQAEAEVADAMSFAEQSAFEPVEDLNRFVYAETRDHG
jgi:TPP-dependent pyruvate/acetoin dehydrogenase alpha subunit